MENNNDTLDNLFPKEVRLVYRNLKSKGIIILGTILFITFLVFIFEIVPFYKRVKNAGEQIGSTAGQMAGIAVGSYDGVTKGLVQGYGDGKVEGLSAKDTDVKIANEMTSLGKLDVLVAEDQFVNDFREGKDYKALFVYKAQTVFSVNMESAEISIEGNTLKIVLPQPECEFIIDENESEKLVDWQKYFWSGSTESGYIGYMNSMAEIKKKAATEMTNYDRLMEQAKASAIKQVSILADSVADAEYSSDIVFKGEE